MLLLSVLLATAPMLASTVQATDNPFGQGAQTRRTTARRSSTRHPSDRSTSTSGGSVYFANCSAARAAGAAPVMRGQPGYSRKLDRDNDGVGCE